MAITDKDIIDSIAYVEESTSRTLILQIYDHLDFEGKLEYDHMTMLQEKLNTYIWYIQSKQYQEIYPQKDFCSYTIKIYFICDITELCKKYIDNANKKLININIHIEYFFEVLKKHN